VRRRSLLRHPLYLNTFVARPRFPPLFTGECENPEGENAVRPEPSRLRLVPGAVVAEPENGGASNGNAKWLGSSGFLVDFGAGQNGGGTSTRGYKLLTCLEFGSNLP
jgi:hypothetical protein